MIFSVLLETSVNMNFQTLGFTAIKGIGIFLLIFIGFSLSNLLAAYISSRIVIKGNPKPITHPVDVYLLSNGVHTDIVVPFKNESFNWGDLVSRKDIKTPNTSLDYIGFGWGDKGFYLEIPTWNDLSFKVAFNAMFALSSSAMHLSWYHKPKENGNCRKITMDIEDYRSLCAYLKKDFELNDNAPILIKGRSYGENDCFYEAIGRYSCFYTCNTWTNNALKAANQKACLWTLFDTGLLKIYS